MPRAVLLAILAIVAVVFFTLAAPPQRASLVSLPTGGCSPARPHDPAGYDTRYDRSFIGDLGPPDGIIQTEDILALVKQLFHDCA